MLMRNSRRAASPEERPSPGAGISAGAKPRRGPPRAWIVATTILSVFTVPAGAGPGQPEAPPCPDPGTCFLHGVSAFRDAHYGEAAAALEQALGDPLGGEEYALYYLALSHGKAGRTTEALALCQRFRQSFPASPLTERMGRLEADAYRRTSEFWPAAQAYERLIAGQDAPDLRLSYGHVLESLDRLTEAHANYQTLRKKWPRSAKAREARGRVRRLEGRVPGLKDRVRETPGLREEQSLAMREGNWPEALSLQEEILTRTVSSSLRRQVLWDRVQTLINSGKLDAAREELRTLLGQYPRSPEAPRALYAVGRGFWRKDRNSEAVPLLERLVDEYTDADEAGPASYILGRIRLEQGDTEGAVRWFRYTRFLFPWTEWEREAAWWEAWSLYRAGHYRACAELLGALDADQVWIPDLVPRSRYWQSRSLERAGDSARSRALYSDLRRWTPPNYYSLLASGRLDRQGEAAPSVEAGPAAAPDVSAPEAPPDGRRDLYGISLQLQDPVLPLLREAGLRRDATERLDWLRARAGPAAALRTEDWISAYSLAGNLARALQAAWRGGMHDELLVRGVSGSDPGSARLLRRLYPLDFWDLIRTRSEAHRLDPYLVAGLIRQESLFQSDALSPAGAMGLMQIMPSTGSRMAEKLGIRDFKTSRLTEPELNIRIGTAYLAELLDRYGPDWNRILANYNAGPRPVAKWTEAMPDAEPDEFVENILYRETRLYVKKVWFNQDIYRRLYGEGLPSERSR